MGDDEQVLGELCDGERSECILGAKILMEKKTFLYLTEEEGASVDRSITKKKKK